MRSLATEMFKFYKNLSPGIANLFHVRQYNCNLRHDSILQDLMSNMCIMVPKGCQIWDLDMAFSSR